MSDKRQTNKRILDCGGKRSATPLSDATTELLSLIPKAVSSLRSATAVHIVPPKQEFVQ